MQFELLTFPTILRSCIKSYIEYCYRKTLCPATYYK